MNIQSRPIIIISNIVKIALNKHTTLKFPQGCLKTFKTTETVVQVCALGGPYLVKNASMELLFWNSLFLGA